MSTGRSFSTSRFSALAVCATSLALAFSVSAQPAAQHRAAAPKGDAGAPKATATADAGATSTTAITSDAGAGSSADLASDAGAMTTAPMTIDASIATTAVTRKIAPPLPPPTPAQIAALNALKDETEAYEKGAREYRDTVTTIIKLHYETKKKEILSGLDKEIDIEQQEMRKARDVAIQRLEEFVKNYSGTRAQPEATPDAMYRLAALYEERARDNDDPNLITDGLKSAIAIYKRLIREFPQYHQIAGIYYFLGHAYNDSSRMNEAQQVWRSLVCHNHFAYPTPPDPKNPEADTILPLPQDHDEAYWTSWRQQHQDPKSLKRKGAQDVSFIDPFPSDCEPLPQPDLKPGDQPSYLPEAWWRIGDFDFEQFDNGGGVVPDEPAAVFDYNRAASAYMHSMQFKKGPNYGVALYKYAWTLFKQQRYEAATKQFITLLEYTDQLQKETGDPGADFRNEAYTYIAGSLTNVEFTGPAADDPFIQLPDIIDIEPVPAIAEKKLHVAIDRARDPNIIPQDKTWTIEIYKALALEFRSIPQYNNAIEVYNIILKQWPCDPSAPDVQNSIAETYDQMNITKQQGTPEHDAIAAKALEARTALANYIGTTAWTDCNKDNPGALQNAEKLVKSGLRQAAVQHTNNGKTFLTAVGQTSDPARQIELLSRSQAEYKLAAIGWFGFLHQDENAPDAYESRYWLADSRHQQVRIETVLHKLARDKYPEPSRQELDDAKASAIDVRDSNEDDKYLDNAALFVVDESDVDRDLEYQRFDDTHGSQGVERRDALRFTGDGDQKKIVTEPVPPVVQLSIQARDEYVSRVPDRLDVDHNAIAYQYYAGETYFLYGQFDLAKARFEPMYKDHCGKDEYGYKAWEKLITMSNATNDAERSRQLAEAEKAHSCAVTADQEAKGKSILEPTIVAAAYQDAMKKFKQAQAAPEGADRQKLFRDAAALFDIALQNGPAADDAPVGAINGAYSYKQVGEFNKAIELYNKFITEYGSDARLSALQNGDSKTHKEPDPKKYAERLGYLSDAYDALGTTYYSFFNYQRAAETYDKVAANTRFEEAKRKTASKNAIVLYASMAERDKLDNQVRIFQSLHPTTDEKANIDYLQADYDYKQWDSKGSDTGANRNARIAAEQSLQRFYGANKANPASAKYSLEAIYQIAKLQKAGGDTAYHGSLKTTIAAWEFLKVHDAKSSDGPPFADYAAEAEYTLLDEEIREKYDYETNHHRYAGSVEDILGTYDPKTQKQLKPGLYTKDAADADKYDKALDHITATYKSVEWVPAALARKGSLFDSLRTGLYKTVPPALKYFTPKQETLLKTLENSGRDDLADQASDLRNSVKDNWRKKKESELAGADQVMISDYARAVALAQRYNVRNPSVTYAIGKLASYTDIIGDAKMHDYVTGTSDPLNPGAKLTYRDGQYLQSRPGVTSTPPASGEPEPAPVSP